MSGAVVNAGFAENDATLKLNGHHTEMNTDKAVFNNTLDNHGYSHDDDKPSSPSHSTVVHQRVEAYQKISESPRSTEVVRNNSRSSFDYGSKEVRRAKVDRDAETLNHCIDEVEAFIIELKAMNDMRMKLRSKGSRKSMKKKYDHLRKLAKGPDEQKISDIYQKFKLSFNLLGKLRTHIDNPNAPELVIYLFVPLEIIVKILGLESARRVVSPLLTVAAIDLLSNCLKSRDQEFWKTLGPNWLLPVSAPYFREKSLPAYIPMFKDGWTPPEIVVDDRGAAAAKSAAVMVERMKIVEEEEVHKKKALEEKQANEVKQLYDVPPAPVPVIVVTRKDEEKPVEEKPSEKPIEKKPIEKQVEKAPEKTVEKRNMRPTDLPKLQLNGEKKYALVIYDYWAHNNKELTIRAGEKVQIIDDSRRWWLVTNQHEEHGYVPSTVLEVSSGDTSSEASSADSSLSPAVSPSGTQNVVFTQQTKVEKRVVTEEVSSQPTVVTAKSIITESSQFSNPSSPVTANPPINVVREDKTTVSISNEVRGPPTFMPPPPPMSTTLPSEKESTINVVIKQPVIKTDSQQKSFQEELSDRIQKQESSTNTNMNTLSAVDRVDFFIPLFKSSTADDVSRWLKRLQFEPSTVDRLQGVAAKELFKTPEQDLIDRLGEEEGKRLYNELQVQTGAMTRHKTMTEFQKALLVRMKRQETIQKNVTKHHVTVKTSGESPTPSQEEMQRKFKEQQDLIRAKQSDNSKREPEKHTFGSFQADNSQTNNNNVSLHVNAEQ